MQDIVFKVRNDRLNILAGSGMNNKEFITSLRNRLERLIVLKDSICKSVILDLGNLSLNNREILELFDVLNEYEIFYLSKVICKKNISNSLVIYKGNFRGGQVRFFEKSLLLIGSINKGSKVIVNGNLYVLGKINGDIELKDKNNRIYCEWIENSLVKIGDCYKLYSEVNRDKEIYLDKEISERDYKKGESDYGKSGSCYIW